MRIGLISDTHGRLRAEVFGHFERVARILHAGDIGPHDLLVELEAIAPVTAVWGNTDGFDVRTRVPETATVELEGRRIRVVHGHQHGSPRPDLLLDAYDEDIIVYGHTHRPLVERRGARLVINPGGAGAPRFGLRPSIALLELGADSDDVQLIEL